MNKSTFALEPYIITLPQQNVKLHAYYVIETLPNGTTIKHGSDAAQTPFATEALAQLWIAENN